MEYRKYKYFSSSIAFAGQLLQLLGILISYILFKPY